MAPRPAPCKRTRTVFQRWPAGATPDLPAGRTGYRWGRRGDEKSRVSGQGRISLILRDFAPTPFPAYPADAPIWGRGATAPWAHALNWTHRAGQISPCGTGICGQDRKAAPVSHPSEVWYGLLRRPIPRPWRPWRQVERTTTLGSGEIRSTDGTGPPSGGAEPLAARRVGTKQPGHGPCPPPVSGGSVTHQPRAWQQGQSSIVPPAPIEAPLHDSYTAVRVPRHVRRTTRKD
jgi:hypothetical protein